MLAPGEGPTGVRWGLGAGWQLAGGEEEEALGPACTSGLGRSLKKTLGPGKHAPKEREREREKERKREKEREREREGEKLSLIHI